MKIVDLCAGGGSVSTALRKIYPDAHITTVDLRKLKEMDGNHTHIVSDIRDLPLSSMEDIDILWASPPCEHYSIARSRGGPRNFALYDSIVKKVLEIITQCKPKRWFIENPGGQALMHKRPFMLEWEPYRRETTYCKFGFLYRKNTSIWSNTLLLHGGLPMCYKDTPCEHRVGRRHPTTAQEGDMIRGGVYVRKATPKLADRWSIPEGLIEHLMALPPPTHTS